MVGAVVYIYSPRLNQRVAQQRTMLNRTRVLENLASTCSCCETYRADVVRARHSGSAIVNFVEKPSKPAHMR